MSILIYFCVKAQNYMSLSLFRETVQQCLNLHKIYIKLSVGGHMDPFRLTARVVLTHVSVLV